MRYAAHGTASSRFGAIGPPSTGSVHIFLVDAAKRRVYLPHDGRVEFRFGEHLALGFVADRGIRGVTSDVEALLPAISVESRAPADVRAAWRAR
jgi:hypothetical protein